MQYSVIGDPHLTKRSMSLVYQVCSWVEESKRPVVWLGDMLHSKEVISGKCLNFWLDYFDSSKVRHIIVVGNHDLHNLEGENHSLQALKKLKNVTVVDEPQLVDGVFFCVPYIHDPERLRKALRGGPKGAILIAHLEINGFDFGNGLLHSGGLTLKVLSKFKAGYTGHFHKFQQGANLTYLGTPFSMSYGEANQTKYVGILTPKDAKLELVELQLPRHLSFELNCDLDFKKITKELPKLNNRDHFRFILTGHQENITEFRHVLNDYLKTEPNLSLSSQVIPRPSKLEETKVVVSDTDAPARQFDKWASKVKNLRKKTIALGLEILEEAAL